MSLPKTYPSGFPDLLVIEPLPEHACYMFGGPVENVNVSIVAMFKDGTVRKLEGQERAEVRRWILGGLALGRVALRATFEDRLLRSMGVPPAKLESEHGLYRGNVWEARDRMERK